MSVHMRDTGINDCQSIVFNNLVLATSPKDANAIVAALCTEAGGEGITSYFNHF